MAVGNLEPNLVFASFAISLFSAFASANTWRTARGRFDGPGFWALGFCAYMLSLGLDFFPVAPSGGGLFQVFSNGLELAGTYLQYLGLKRFLGDWHGGREKLVAVLAAVLWVVSAWFLVLEPGSRVPLLLESLGNFGLALINTVKLTQAVAGNMKRQQVFALAAFIFVTLLLAFNMAHEVLSLLGGPAPGPGLFVFSGPVAWMLLFSVLVMAENQLVNGRIFSGFDSALHRLEQTRRQLETVNAGLDTTQEEILLTLAGVMENRSQETANHVIRVAGYSRLLAHHWGLPPDKVELIARAAPLHDIGKTGIPDEILLKAGPLGKEERELMQTHALLGYSILVKSGMPLFVLAARIALEHHEHWDGSGYPGGKKGEETSLEGRIVALADQFDAVLSKRIYKEEWSAGDTLDFVRQGRGSRFDPVLADLLLAHQEEFMQITRDRH